MVCKNRGAKLRYNRRLTSVKTQSATRIISNTDGNKTCESCGGKFDSSRPVKRFCTSKCQRREEGQRRYYRLKGKAAKKTRTCVICSGTFTVNRLNVTCSKACREQLLKRARKKYNDASRARTIAKRLANGWTPNKHREVEEAVIYEEVFIFKRCEICDAEYRARGIYDKYCGKKCMWKAANRRRKRDISNRLVRAYYAAIKRACGGSLKTMKWSHKFGYTPTELCKHIESKMLIGMTWANYGSVWHVDHRQPIADVRRCGADICDIFALDNLMPRFATTEVSKRFGWNQTGNLNKGANATAVADI